MSRFLKYKKIGLIAGLVIFVEAILAIGVINSTAVYKEYVGDRLLLGVLVVDVFAIIILCLNFKVLRILKHQMDPFGAKSTIRNVDVLAIGEKADVMDVGKYNCNKDDQFVQLVIPGISEYGAFEVLKRTHSILKPRGKVIIFLVEKNRNNAKLRMLDTFFLHDITIRENNIERLSKYKRFILIFNPLESIQLLQKCKNGRFKPIRGGADLTKFCEERSYVLEEFIR